MNVNRTFFLLLLMGLLTNCGGKSADPAPVTQAQLLAKTWRMAAVLLNGTPDATDYSQYRIIYRPDGTYTGTGYQGDSFSGTWELAGNGNAIVYNRGTGQERQELIVLTATNLDRTYTTQNYKSGNVELVMQMVPAP
jgi:hypothetical protein